MTHFRIIVVMTALLALAGCSRPTTGNVVSGAAATQTVQARMPTLQAQIAAASTNAALTVVAGGGGAVSTPAAGGGTVPVTGQPGGAGGTADGGSPVATSATGGGAAGTGSSDQHDTRLTETLTPGQPREAEIVSDFDAHNWLVAASGGQRMTITVEAIGETDPVIDLLDPAGMLLTSVDSGGRGDPESITYTLPSTGTYTIRIKAWKVGKYRITVTLA